MMNLFHLAQERAAYADSGPLSDPGSALLKTLLNTTPCAIAVLSGIGWRVRWLNDGISALLAPGLQCDRAIGFPLRDVLAGYAANGLDEILRTAAETNQAHPISGYRQYCEKQGMRYWVGTVTPMPGLHPYPDLMIHLIDATAMVLAQQSSEAELRALRQERRLIKTIQANTDDLNFAFDRHGRFVYTNQAVQELLQQTDEGLAGKRLSDLELPSGLASALQKKVDEAIFSGKPVQGEIPFKPLVGPARRYEYTLVPVKSEDGRVESLVGCSRVIGKSRQAAQTRQPQRRAAGEIQPQSRSGDLIDASRHPPATMSFAGESLAAIFNTVSCGIILHDHRGGFIECNAAAERIIGLPREHLLHNPSLHTLVSTVHEDGSPFQWEMHPAMIALETKQAQHNVVMGIYRSDASLVWILINVEPILDQHGNAYQAVCSFVDITGRKHTEEALWMSHTQLRRFTEHHQNTKEEERRRIARDIHDDLGQNLLALKIHLSLLGDRAAEAAPSLRKDMGQILSHLNAAIGTVRSIMNELRPPMLDELGLYAAVQWQLRQFQEVRGIQCTLVAREEDFDTELDNDVASTLYRIVQESLANIARHAEASQVEITLLRDKCHLQMTIADNGVGMRLADRHKRTSFGLLGIEERMHALGGKFSICSTPGSGTTLSIFLPARDKLLDLFA